MTDTAPLGDLPTRFAIFPLPNVVLFPGTMLPLHIFEPRYRAMMEAALAGDSVIGMILLKHERDALATRPPTFGLGCLGRIAEHERLADGRFNLLLHGACRFRVLREVALELPYRTVEAELVDEPRVASLAPSQKSALAQARTELEARMLELVGLTAPENVAPLAERMRALDPILLLNAIAFGLECPVLEKQSVLETIDVAAQSELLLRVLEFRIAEARLPEAPRSLN
jgi:uncharacterized protein